MTGADCAAKVGGDLSGKPDLSEAGPAVVGIVEITCAYNGSLEGGGLENPGLAVAASSSQPAVDLSQPSDGNFEVTGVAQPADFSSANDRGMLVGKTQEGPGRAACGMPHIVVDLSGGSDGNLQADIVPEHPVLAEGLVSAAGSAADPVNISGVEVGLREAACAEAPPALAQTGFHPLVVPGYEPPAEGFQRSVLDSSATPYQVSPQAIHGSASQPPKEKPPKPRCECGHARPRFGPPGDRRDIRWCAKCPGKPESAKFKDLGRTCECGVSQPTIGLKGDSRARWCAKCPGKPPEAYNIVKKRCECGLRRPYFGLPGEPAKAARWCMNCPSKPETAINIVSKTCACGAARPYFGLPGGSGQKEAIWCAKCPDKPSNAFNIADKKCECGMGRPYFGKPGDKRPRWCAECPLKSPDAINVENHNCECGLRRATFGYPGERKRWCASCKPEDMPSTANITRMCECGKRRPRLSIKGQRPNWCSLCPGKPAEARDYSKRRCRCGNTRAYYKVPGGTVQWCAYCPDRPPEAFSVVKQQPAHKRKRQKASVFDDSVLPLERSDIEEDQDEEKAHSESSKDDDRAGTAERSPTAVAEKSARTRRAKRRPPTEGLAGSLLPMPKGKTKKN